MLNSPWQQSLGKRNENGTGKFSFTQTNTPYSFFGLLAYKWLHRCDRMRKKVTGFTPQVWRWKSPRGLFPLTRLGAKCDVTEWHTARTPGDSFGDVMTYRTKSRERKENAWVLPWWRPPVFSPVLRMFVYTRFLIGLLFHWPLEWSFHPSNTLEGRFL